MALRREQQHRVKIALLHGFASAGDAGFVFGVSKVRHDLISPVSSVAEENVRGRRVVEGKSMPYAVRFYTNVGLIRRGYFNIIADSPRP